MTDARILHIPNVNDCATIVGVVSAIALAANPARVDADFVNDGDSIILSLIHI